MRLMSNLKANKTKIAQDVQISINYNFKSLKKEQSIKVIILIKIRNNLIFNEILH